MLVSAKAEVDKAIEQEKEQAKARASGGAWRAYLPSMASIYGQHAPLFYF